MNLEQYIYNICMRVCVCYIYSSVNDFGNFKFLTPNFHFYCLLSCCSYFTRGRKRVYYAYWSYLLLWQTVKPITRQIHVGVQRCVERERGREGGRVREKTSICSDWVASDNTCITCSGVSPLRCMLSLSLFFSFLKWHFHIINSFILRRNGRFSW